MKSKLSSFICLIVTVLLLDVSIKVDARQNDKRRKDKSNLSASTFPHNNICGMNDRDSKVHCYCESTKLSKNVSKAECWVFNGGIPEDDPVWPNFVTQPNLRELSFNVRVDGGLNFVPTTALNYLRQLVNFNIKYASIHEVSPYAFGNISTMREIALSANEISALKPYAFCHMPNLTILTLDDNKIIELVRDAFCELPSLHKLYLTSNNISIVQDGAFKHLINLIDLEMDNNSITTLNKKSFDGLANLKRLDLRNNKMNKLFDFTFIELWNLQELLLDNNELQMISERAFDGLTQLWMLSLSENKLVSLVSGLFEGVRGITHVDLHSNKIRYLTYTNMKPILDNMKNGSSYFNLEGNALSCDCRLLWLYRLRNSTKSDTIKTSLKRVTCFTDPALRKQLTFDPVSVSGDEIEIVNENKVENIGIVDVYFESDTQDKRFSEKDDIGDVLYDDKILDNLASNNYDHFTYKEKEKFFFDIAPEKLPCPQEVLDPTESTQWHPNQGEIKDFRNINSAVRNPFIHSFSYSILLISYSAIHVIAKLPVMAHV